MDLVIFSDNIQITISMFLCTKLTANRTAANSLKKSTFEVLSNIERSECSISEAMGASFPGQPELPPILTCETELSNYRFGNSVFHLTGNTTSLLHGINLSNGDVRISFPLSALKKESNEIVLNDETLKDIYVTFSGDERRRLSEIASGTKYMLVVRVGGYTTDSNGNSHLKQPEQSVQQLSNDFFHWSNNNLVSSMR